MESAALRSLIQAKLGDGRLPLNSIPRVWGGPGNGETCDACEQMVTKHELIMEGISLANGRKPIQLHTECFYLWEKERHVLGV